MPADGPVEQVGASRSSRNVPRKGKIRIGFEIGLKVNNWNRQGRSESVLTWHQGERAGKQVSKGQLGQGLSVPGRAIKAGCQFVSNCCYSTVRLEYR